MARYLKDGNKNFLRCCELCVGCQGKLAYDIDGGCPQFIHHAHVYHQYKKKRRPKPCSMEDFEALENKQRYY